MTELVFVRHGSTENLEARQWQGWSPVPLSQLGRAQAQAAAARLAGEAPIEMIFSSPIARAWETAQIIASAAGCPVSVCEGLKERMTPKRLWGIAHDETPEYAVETRAHRLDAAWSYEDEEPWPVLAGRVQDVMALIRGLTETGARFVLVTHGITVRLIAAALLSGDGSSLADWLRVYEGFGSPACCSFARFRTDADGEIRLERWNDTAHLDSM